MKTLIFEPTLSGHHLEYLHHYYLGALEKTDEEFIFLVHKDFERVKQQYAWPQSDNISFQYIDDKFDSKLKCSNIYVLGWNVSRVLNHYVRKLGVDKVLLTMLMQFIPFIIFLLPSKVRVRGIMYKIYLYEQERMSTARLLAEKLRFWIASKSKIIDTIFVLNDEDSAKKFNEIYSTSKFKFLPDPVPDVALSDVKDLRKELGISNDCKIYLHFGGLNQRKGTLDILRAIIDAPQEILNNKVFVFAGKQNDAFRKLFYPLYDQAKRKCKIIVFDEFCTYEHLYNLCYTCDVVLMPYYLTNLSSGVLGYAALFGKPVIGPKAGLIGHLIAKYQLGVCVDIPFGYESIKIELKKPVGQNEYTNKNHLNSFIKQILK